MRKYGKSLVRSVSEESAKIEARFMKHMEHILMDRASPMITSDGQMLNPPPIDKRLLNLALYGSVYDPSEAYFHRDGGVTFIRRKP